MSAHAPSRWAWIQLTLLTAGVLAAVELPPVPDPIGLGPRLALIEHLRAEYGQTIAAGIDDAELQQRYAQAWRARQPLDTQAEQRARVRQRLRDRWGVQAPAAAELITLLQLEQTLSAQKTERDAEHLQQRLAEPAPLQQLAPPAAVVAAKKAEIVPRAAAIPEPTATTVPFAVEGVAGALLIRGRKSALCVQFGHERSTEFTGVFNGLFSLLEKGAGPSHAVFLLGHGSGVSINGAPIGPHLRQHKAFYETFGGTRPAQRIECIVIASCSKGSPVQMSAMREGFGYYPTWRVATAERCYASAVSVLAAFQGIADRTAEAPFRGIFRMGREPEVVGSVGEVGVNGDKGGMEYFDIGVEDGAIRVREH